LVGLCLSRLVLLDLFSQEKRQANLIEPGPEPSELFTLYWQKYDAANDATTTLQET